MKSPVCTPVHYTVPIEVPKPRQEVFHHLLHSVASFWPEDLEGQTARLNDEFIFTTGDSHYSRNKVVELIPDQKVVWLVTESLRKTDNFDWTGTRMAFQLTTEDDQTRLEFTFDGPVLEEESDRLVQICDFVIKDRLYRLLTSHSLTIQLKGSPLEVFDKIREIPKWWTRDFAGSTKNLRDEFIIHHPGSHYSCQKLVESLPGQRLVWVVTSSELNWLTIDKEEWTGTKMIFDLSPDGDNTILHFTHEGLTPDKECYARCRQGWDLVIKERLFNYTAGGNGA